jgi:shikimate dehydrogenase
MNRLAVLGRPVSHSRSPAMHNAALAAMGLGGEWRYEAIEVDPAGFERLVDAMPGEGFRGANVTVPHKGAALAVADAVSEVAGEIGAANTLTFEERGVRADNTDAPGLLAALGSRSLRERRALVLGAGGAGRAAVWALCREGARVEVWNRTPLRAKHLCAEVGGRTVAAPDVAAYELIVNTTAVGLRGEDPFAELPLSRRDLHEGQLVLDMVYGEEPTELLRAAADAGAETVDGIEVLVQQGALSLRAWVGRQPPLEPMRAAARG